MFRASLFALALCLAACTHIPPLPVLPPPAASARVDAPPGEREANFSLVLSAPLSELASLLQDQLNLPNAPDWQQVSEQGQSPEVEVRYEAELRAPQISLEAQVLVLKLQVAYFGALRARVHTPFGWVRLTKGTNWGDAEHRGLIELDVRVQLEVGEDYQLRAQSALQDVRFTAPPIDQICAGGAFKLCVPAELAARPIHAELEKRIRARADSGLARVDERIRERGSLAEHARRMWQTLSETGPALPSGERLQLRPRTLSLSYPFIAGDALTIVLGIMAEPRFSAEPDAPAQPLPPLLVAAPGPTFVPLAWLEPLAAINAGLSEAARNGAHEEEQTPTAIELLGPAEGGGRFLVALELTRAGQVRRVYGEASLALADDGLALSELSLSPESEQLLTLAKIERSTFVAAASAAVYRPRAAIDARVRALRSLVAQSLAPLPMDPLPNARATLTAAHATAGGLWLEAELR